MLEVVELIMRGDQVILVINDIEEDALISSDKVWRLLRTTLSPS